MSERPLQKAKLEHSSVKLLAHNRLDCSGRPCALHHRTKHSMRKFPQHWRSDRGIIERICPEHGTGHPDPDQFWLWESRDENWQKVHGCCGCCGEWEERK